MTPNATHATFVDTRQHAGLGTMRSATPATPPPKLRRAPHPERANRLSRLLGRFLVWAVATVLLALGLDVVVRDFFPSPDFQLDLAIIAAVTLPLLAAGGHMFVRQALQQERALHWQQTRHWLRARRDALVWADNRLGFSEAVDHLHSSHPNLRAGLFLLDLHEFQRVNDACGHAVGDQVLRETARRVGAVMHHHAAAHTQAQPRQHRWGRPRLIRVGSDEFACWLPGWAHDASGEAFAKALLNSLQKPFKVGGMTLHFRGNVGYMTGLIGEEGLQHGQTWLTRVNAAAQQAKRQGAGQWAAFACEHLGLMVRRHQVQQGLEAALRDGQGLRLHYQPIVSVQHGGLVGCEALLRWQHPEWGPVSPAEFIPVAEGSDLIRPLGRWVLTEGLRQLAQWRANPALPSARALRVSINLSRAQLLDTEWVEFVRSELQRHAVPAQNLCLEVTESLPLDDPECVQVLHQLHGLGLKLALDDFGTGYSSLSALLNLPLDSVKIDRQFISGIDDCTHRQSLVAAVVRVAQGMQLNVVAEGIEKPAEAKTLTWLGCHHMQGWLISAGIDGDAFASRWLQTAAQQAPTRPAADARAHTPIVAEARLHGGKQTLCDLDTCSHERFGRCPAMVPAAHPIAHPMTFPPTSTGER